MPTPQIAFPGSALDVPLKPVPSGDRCAVCRFWHIEEKRKNPGAETFSATCRRYPAEIQVIPVQVPIHPTQRSMVLNKGGQPPVHMVPQPMAVRASMNETDWCGEFQPRLE